MAVLRLAQLSAVRRRRPPPVFMKYADCLCSTFRAVIHQRKHDTEKSSELLSLQMFA